MVPSWSKNSNAFPPQNEWFIFIKVEQNQICTIVMFTFKIIWWLKTTINIWLATGLKQTQQSHTAELEIRHWQVRSCKFSDSAVWVFQAFLPQGSHGWRLASLLNWGGVVLVCTVCGEGRVNRQKLFTFASPKVCNTLTPDLVNLYDKCLLNERVNNSSSWEEANDLLPGGKISLKATILPTSRVNLLQPTMSLLCTYYVLNSVLGVGLGERGVVGTKVIEDVPLAS